MSAATPVDVRFGRSFFLALLAVVLIGCEPAGEQAVQQPPVQEAPGVPPAAAPAPPGAAALSGAEIAQILSVTDSAEIMPSQLALERAQNPQVREFAQRMITEHGMLEDSLRALEQRTQLTPAPSSLSQQIQAESRGTMRNLQQLSGAEFDRAYVQAMVQSHQEALNTIDTQLIPSAQEPGLRTALEQRVRPVVASHLQQIQQIQQTMGSR